MAVYSAFLAKCVNLIGAKRLTIRSHPQKDGDGKEQMGQKRHSKAEAKGGPS